MPNRRNRPKGLPTRRERPTTKRQRRRITPAEALARKLKAAAQLLDHGLKLVLLHGTTDAGCTCRDGPDCSRAGKHPATPRGVEDATGDFDAVRAALEARPRLNFAVATGKASGILVLDLDRRNRGDVSLAALEAALGPLPRTWTLVTGNGEHRYYAYPAGPPLPTRHGGALGPGIDLQSDGAYGVTATSRHLTGARYRWRRGLGPDNLPIAELPAVWLMKLREGDEPGPSAGRAPGAATSPVRMGGRNTHLTRIGGSLRNTGLTGEGLVAALSAINRGTCVPPLPDDDVAKIAASLSRYAANERDGDEAEALAQAVLNEHFAGGEHLLFANDGQFWSYIGTHWQPLARPALQHRILQTQRLRAKGRQATTTLLGQAMTLLAAEQSNNDDPLRFSAPPLPIVNCRNGELWLDEQGSITWRPHDPKSYLRHCLDVDYDPAATCPRFDAALDEIFGAASPPKGMVRHWWELTGYIIQPRRDIALIVICEGMGSNGKTKVLETIQRLLGDGLVSAMRIQSLDSNRFATSDLLGKLLLIDDDLQSGVRLPDGELKKVSEAKTITAERKHGPSFTFTVRTVPVLLCNNPPSLADLSHGMQRRLMVIPFNRIFDEKEADKTLFPAIWASELPGILNGALAGLQRLAERGYRFNKPEAVTTAEARWLARANPVAAFVRDRCRTEGNTPTGDLYAAYQAWCAENGITMTQQRLAFVRNLEHLGYPPGRNARARLTMGLSLR